MKRLLPLILVLFFTTNAASYAAGPADERVEGTANYDVTINLKKEVLGESGTIQADLITVAGRLMIAVTDLNRVQDEFLYHYYMLNVDQDREESDRYYLNTPLYYESIVEFQVGSSSYIKRDGDGNPLQTAELSLPPMNVNGDVYVPLEVFEFLNFGVRVQDRSIVIDMADGSGSAVLQSLELGDGLRLSPAFSPDISEYALQNSAGDTIKLTVHPASPGAKVAVDGVAVRNFAETSVPTKGKNVLTIASESQDGKDKRTYTIKVHDSLEIQGKAMALNGRVIPTVLTPKVDSGNVLVPLADTLKALGFAWTLSADKSEAVVNRYGARIPMQVLTVEGASMLRLKDVSEQLAVQTSVYQPPALSKRTIPASEQKARADVAAAFKAVAAAQAAYENANKKYQATLAGEPVFIVSGQISSRKPFYLWGTAFSDNAPLDHPAWAAAYSTNILVQNPDSGKIAYNQYVQGLHYYKGATTAKGNFGQNVPVYIFGGPSASLQKKINAAKANLDKAAKSLKASKDGLAGKKTKLIRTVKSYYDSVTKKNPKNAQAYLAYAMALSDTAVQIQETRDLITQATTKSEKADAVSPGIAVYFMLYLADRMDTEAKRIEMYREFASVGPAIVLQYCDTAQQYWIAGNALEDEGREDYAAFAYKQAAALGDAKLKAKAQKKLDALAKK
mgnify:CR=1 FL=1